uniref:LAGLIDADG homing endonuclease n=1 Tax=Tricholoma bakamatsutake TaxID=51221 RepID=A0A6C0W797_9AGAR|nr:LAGLIDADG homing endonuclease [Tricholoma bakamatsutake]QIC20211.1 LAGLIDADG homing endonuclease [Tricholoma bakamatsutake]
MVNGLCYLNYIEFSLILGLFSLLFRKFLNSKLKRFILNLKNKYIKNKDVESINDENVSLNKVFNTVDKYTDYIIVFIFICLFWIKFINIYFSSNLADNIDSFVKVYNHIKNNSFFCLFSIKNEYIVSKNYLCNTQGEKNNNRNFILPFSFLNEIKFINILMLNLKIYSLYTSPIIICLFTFTISILLGFMEVAPLLGSCQITSDFTFPLGEISCWSSAFITSDSNAILVSQHKSNTEIKHKFQIIQVQVTVPFNELTEIRFIQILMLNLKLNSLNTILFQYNEYSTFTNLILAPQLGIVVKDKHDISYYRILFDHYIEKLESIMSLYNVGTPDFIVIHLKEILVDDNIKIGRFVIDYPSNDVMKEIYIPKHLYFEYYNDAIKSIKLVPKLLNDLPLVLKDMKSLINN